MSAAGGGGDCPDPTTTSDRPEASEADVGDAPTTSAQRTQKPKPAPASRAGNGSRPSAPRWHSFLPGMIR